MKLEAAEGQRTPERSDGEEDMLLFGGLPGVHALVNPDQVRVETARNSDVCMSMAARGIGRPALSPLPFLSRGAN